MLSKIANTGKYSTNTLDEKLPPYHQFHHEDKIKVRRIKNPENVKNSNLFALYKNQDPHNASK